MEASSQLCAFFRDLAFQLPSILTMLAGIVFALIRWRRHPKVSAMVVISLVLMLLHVIAFSVIFLSLRLFVNYGDYQRYETYRTLVSVAYNVVLAVITAILISAIFIKRNDPGDPLVIEGVAQARAA